MAYVDDILALSPDHLWTFDNVLTDSVGTATGVASGATLTAKTDLSEVNTYCLRTDAITERVILPSLATISNSTQSRKAFGGWFQVDRYQSPPKVIYAEGGVTTSFKIVLGWGNRLVFELDEGAVFQIFGDVILEPNRSYHLMLQFEGTGYGNILTAYLDGISQLSAEPSNRIPNIASRTAATVAHFGDPAGTVSIGGTEIILLAPINGSYANWASWSDKVLPTATEVREELFAKGALPANSISSQADLDTYAGTVRGNTPLSFEITGTSLDLNADNITFDPLCSLHIRWEGTGVLNWTNTNGSNASTYVATNGGTVNIINPATLTINGVIDGAEVRIYDDEIVDVGNNNTELDGIESNSGTSFSFSHSGATNTVAIQHMVDGYEEIKTYITLGSADQSITLFPKIEENT